MESHTSLTWSSPVEICFPYGITFPRLSLSFCYKCQAGLVDNPPCTTKETLKAPGLSSRPIENRYCVVAKCRVQHRSCMLPYDDWLGVYTARLDYKNRVMRDCQDRAVVVDGGTSDLFVVGEGVGEVVSVGVADRVGEGQDR